MLRNFANQVVVFDKLEAILLNSGSAANQQLLASLAPFKQQQIGLVSPSEEYGIAVAKPETYLLTRINNAIDTASRANILESLKLRFVMGEPTPDTPLMPRFELASPVPAQPTSTNPLRR